MWPEFEGKRYKLEHRFQGRIKGTKISGKLLVREEGLPDFEVLRDFVGGVEPDGTIVIDGMFLKRTGKD